APTSRCKYLSARSLRPAAALANVTMPSESVTITGSTRACRTASNGGLSIPEKMWDRRHAILERISRVRILPAPPAALVHAPLARHRHSSVLDDHHPCGKRHGHLFDTLTVPHDEIRPTTLAQAVVGQAEHPGRVRGDHGQEVAEVLRGAHVRGHGGQ